MYFSNLQINKASQNPSKNARSTHSQLALRPTGGPHGQAPHPGWVKARPSLDRSMGVATARVGRRARRRRGEAGPERGRTGGARTACPQGRRGSPARHSMGSSDKEVGRRGSAAMAVELRRESCDRRGNEGVRAGIGRGGREETGAARN